MFKKVALAISLAVVTSTGAFAADTWTIDRTHSDVTFKVRHLIANTTGRFDDFSGVVVTDAKKPQNSSVQFTIKTASIDTDNESRDKHLRSEDFFDAEKNPEITFKSTSIKSTSKYKFAVTGDLTMRGVTKKIVLPVTFLGMAKDPGGKERAGFETSLKLNRKDYGINWNKSLDAGGYLLSDDVAITINLETVKKVEAAAASK